MQDELEAPEQLKLSTANFVLRFSDGTVRSTSLGPEEIRDLIGTEGEYTLQWWIRGAERKLAVREFLTTLTDGPKSASSEKVLKHRFTYGSSWHLDWPAHETLHFSGSYDRPHAI
jgi:hypothetical protein